MVMNGQNIQTTLKENYQLVIVVLAFLLVATSISFVMYQWHHGDMQQYGIQLNGQSAKTLDRSSNVN